MLIETPAPRKARFHLLSFLLTLLNSLGLLSGLLAILLLVIFGSQAGMQRSERFTFSALGWASLAMLVLLLPGLVYAIRRLAGSEKPAFSVANPLRVARILVFIWPLLMLGAYFAAQSNGLPGAILAPMQILVIGIPIWYLLEISRRNLPGGKAHQGWGVFSAGMLIAMPLALIVESILVVVVVILAANAIMGQDALMEEINRLAMRISSANLDPEVLSRALMPILRRPAVLATILMMASGLVPLVEELFKPLGMWALSKKKLTPAQGFNLGMVSGAAFAFLESLGYLSGVSGTDWVLTAAGRVGSALLHITCSGLVGWGLAEAWTNRRYGRLALGYAAAVMFHGLWNLFGILVGLVPFIDVTAGLVGFLRGLGVIAPYALGVIGVGLFLILMFMNQYLRRQSALELAAAAPALPVEPQMHAEPLAYEQVFSGNVVDSPTPEFESKSDGTDSEDRSGQGSGF